MQKPAKPKPPEDSLGIVLPEEKELPPLEGHDKCNITCENCLEEYNLTAEDGLAGMEFPCEVCGEMVDVPPHPWPEPETQEEAEDDFLDVGTPVKAKKEEAKKAKPDKPSEPKPEAKPKASSKGAAGGDGMRLCCFACPFECDVVLNSVYLCPHLLASSFYTILVNPHR